MEEKNSKRNRLSKTKLLSAVLICLLLFSIIQCGRYTKQTTALTKENEELSAALADQEQNLHDQTQETEDLQAQLAEATSIEEYETESGLIKKGGVYLIDEVSQLRTVERLIAEDREIEPGIPAAKASYRLRSDLSTDNGYDGYGFLCLGTEERPFCGSFDGDGHRIEAAFTLMDGADVPEAMFYADTTAKIENLQITNRGGHYDTLAEYTDCEELENHLPDCSGCRIRTEISAWDLDARKTAKALRTYWEKNGGKDGAYVSMTYFPDPWWEPPAEAETYLPNLHTALTTLAGSEYTEIIEEALAQETGYLWFVKLERIGELTCCTFEIGETTNYGPSENDSYYIIVEGNWEGKEVRRQCLRIPYTGGQRNCIGVNPRYRLERVDLNFDGKADLLIDEGSSGGTGGSHIHYRALVWKENIGQFAWFSSFPAHLVSLEFDRHRVVNSWRSGVSCECVEVYGVVNGEYICTRMLLLESVQRDGEYVTELSYYEMGELVETHVLSDDWYEKVELYPDMNYWSKG